MKRCVLALSIFLMQNSLFAENVQSLDLLKLKIEQFLVNDLAVSVEGKIAVSVEKMDSRLQLRACAEEKLEVFNPHHSPVVNTRTMGIKCTESDNHWTLYVPVKISVLQAVYAAKQALSKGSRIGPHDIYMQEMDTRHLKQGYYTDEQQIVGLICKQAMRQGMPFSPLNVQIPRLVQRGQQVNIVAGTDAFTVKMPGIALNDGTLGETVSVKNLSSKKILEGRISARQEVRVLN